jgi:hypothetical protein
MSGSTIQFALSDYTVSAVGPGPTVAVLPQSVSGRSLPPAIICSIFGAPIYSVEITGDNVLAPGYNAAAGVYVALATMNNLTMNAQQGLSVICTGIRVRMSGGIGSVRFQFPQLNGLPSVY